jgi:hypothetical protein
MLATNWFLCWLAISRSFDSLGKLTRPRLHLFEKARVFDRNDGLVGEGLQQLNLSVGKWAQLRATHVNYPDGFASANKGNGQYGVVAKTPGNRAALRILVQLGLHIGKVNRLSVEDGTPYGISTRQLHSGYPSEPAVRNYAEHVPVLLPDRRVV